MAYVVLQQSWLHACAYMRLVVCTSSITSTEHNMADVTSPYSRLPQHALRRGQCLVVQLILSRCYWQYFFSIISLESHGWIYLYNSWQSNDEIFTRIFQLHVQGPSIITTSRTSVGVGGWTVTLDDAAAARGGLSPDVDPAAEGSADELGPETSAEDSSRLARSVSSICSWHWRKHSCKPHTRKR